ncbi:hypothetical protein TRICI_001458 [Trichomonascus ciferrii]|uniref:C2 domain-containing protein n=1 Tax=Trichomonascus ciferrii TaxID=44093 RepID=A0A642V9D2_9ASCO|nr:hypothetical protein TRICI_001458 [Trichomonascus ciferrii]
MPAWDHEVRFELKDMKDHRVLKLSVLDENDSKPELIGDTVIMLDKALESLPSEGYDAWHELEFKGKYAGEVYLEMTFYPAKPHIPPKKKRTRQKRPKSAMDSMSSYSRPLPSHPSQPTVAPSPSTSSSMSTASYDLAYEFDNLSMNASRRNLPPVPPQQHQQQQQPYPPQPGYYYPPPPVEEEHDECCCEDCHQQLPFLPSIPPGPPEDYNPRPRSASPHPPPPPQQRAHSVSPQPQPQPRAHSVSPQPQSRPRPQSVSPQPSPSSNRVQRKPVGGGQVRRKPVNSGLPHTPEFDEGIDPIPFSADSYENKYTNGTPPAQHQQRYNHSDTVLDVNTYAPEPVRRRTPPQPTTHAIDPGLAGYNGEGQWDISRKINDGYGDSIFNRVIRNNVNQQKPELPPKIPIGMSRDEYLAAEQQYQEQDPYHYRTYI